MDVYPETDEHLDQRDQNRLAAEDRDYDGYDDDMNVEKNTKMMTDFGGGWDDSCDDGVMFAEGGGGFDFSFDQVEKLEKVRTNAMISTTERTLYGEQYDYQELALANDRADKRESEGMRYFSEGYGANVDQVDDLEYARWQSSFPYLQVIGTTLVPVAKDSIIGWETEGMINDQEHFLDINYHRVEAPEQLAVVGKSLHIESLSATYNNDAEEIITEDGIVEELIAASNCPDEMIDPDGSDDNTLKYIEPENSKKDEMISSIAQLVWPTAVEAMRPLIKDVIAALRDVQGGNHKSFPKKLKVGENSRDSSSRSYHEMEHDSW